MLGVESVTLILSHYSDYSITACIESRANIVKERALLGIPGGLRHIVFVAASAIPEADLSSLAPGVSV